MEAKKQRLLSLILTLTVLAVLLVAAPAQAINLKVVKLPKNGATDSIVEFDLGANIKGNEHVPVEKVTLLVSGPSGDLVCEFEPDGTPISGCDGISITPDLVTSEVFNEELVGHGWTGESNEWVEFGYGYGFGYATGQGANQELTWTVEWDTTGVDKGKYDVSFMIEGSGSEGAGSFESRQSDTITLK